MYLKNHTKDKREKRRRKEVQQQRKSNCLPKAQGTRLLQQQNIQSIMAFTRLCNRICNILFWGLLASLKFVNSLFATAPDPTYYFQINIELPLFTSRHKSQQFPLSVLNQLREREGRPNPLNPLWICHLQFMHMAWACKRVAALFTTHISESDGNSTLCGIWQKLVNGFFRRRIPNAESGKKFDKSKSNPV